MGWGEMEGTESIQIVSTDADSFAAAGRNSTRGHFGKIDI